MKIAFALPTDLSSRLEPDAVRHGHELVARCASAAELLAALDAAPEICMVAANEHYLNAQLLAACDDRGIRILPLVRSADEGRHLTTLGLLESVDARSTWPELERELAITTVRPSLSPEPALSATNRTIAIWGPAGAPGRTTVAINLAAELAASGRTVALADVDTYSGSIAPALGMLDEAPGFAAACRLAGTGSLTNAELERVASRYGNARSSFWVLTGIGRPSRWPELSAAKVETAIKQCRTWAEYTVLDTGFNLESDEEIVSDQFAPRRNAATLAALREADIVVGVGAADPVGLSRFLRAHVDLNEIVSPDRIVVAMNKVRATAIGVNPSAQVAQTLSRFGRIDSAVMIPFDQSALDAALLTGRTLADAAPKSPVRAALRELALTATR